MSDDPADVVDAVTTRRIADRAVAVAPRQHRSCRCFHLMRRKMTARRHRRRGRYPWRQEWVVANDGRLLKTAAAVAMTALLQIGRSICDWCGKMRKAQGSCTLVDADYHHQSIDIYECAFPYGHSLLGHQMLTWHQETAITLLAIFSINVSSSTHHIKCKQSRHAPERMQLNEHFPTTVYAELNADER